MHVRTISVENLPSAEAGAVGGVVQGGAKDRKALTYWYSCNLGWCSLGLVSEYSELIHGALSCFLEDFPTKNI